MTTAKTEDIQKSWKEFFRWIYYEVLSVHIFVDFFLNHLLY